MTFGDTFCCTLCTSVAEAWIPNGTGLAPRTSAVFLRASRSLPARRATARAAASVTHALRPSAGVPGAAASEYCVPLHDDCTTCQGYVAEASV
jgi:hypothetical protein